MTVLSYAGSVLIANGTSLSSAINLAGQRLAAIQMPAAWDAAALTLQGSFDGVTYASVYDTANTEISWTVAAARFYLLPSTLQLLGLKFLKVRSGTSTTPVNQTADRTLQLISADPNG